MKKQRIKFSSVYLAVILFLTYVPILLTVIYSFNASKLTSVWEGFSLKWYQELFRDRDLREALINSLILALSSCSAATIIGTMGALGMKKVPLKTNGLIEAVSTMPMMIPEIILGIVFMAAFSLVGLPFGMTTLIIAHTAFCIPYIFMMVRARLEGMDQSIEDAARDLGAGPFRLFWDITLPMILPAVLSGMLLAFAMSFDDVIISLFVTGPRVNTLPVKIYTKLKTGVTPEINALATIMLAVIVLALLLSNFISGRKRHRKVRDI
ncbi:MAG: ABC transporter permease [Firmicutes bacterium]|nr:ABC transporter permease [Bacillota bacterium]MBR6500109.1 ABC transporter permease [Bacillota bacterium]